MLPTASNSPLNPEPLTYGALAPGFSLAGLDGKPVTRNEFRNKQALVLLFVQPTAEAAHLLQQVSADLSEYTGLGALVMAITPIALADLATFFAAHHLTMMGLSDTGGGVWRDYVQTDRSGCGVFVLDIYGGVDSQRVAESVSGLPAAAKILEWTRGAQYRCSI